MKKFNPEELSVTVLPKLRVAVLGTCVAGHLVAHADTEKWEVHHFLMESHVLSPFPSFDPSNYDCFVIHLTLRHILANAHPDHDGDLFHARHTGISSIYDNVLVSISETIKRVIANLPESLPIFFLSFYETKDPVQGLIANESDMSLSTLLDAMNLQIVKSIKDYSNAFFVEINDLIRFHGDANLIDSYITHTTHAGLLTIPNKPSNFERDIWDRIGALYRVFKGFDRVKLIITDLDNTLWIGVASEEDDIASWRFTEGWPTGYAESLMICKTRGILLAISSKNDEKNIKNLFPKIWGKRLQLDDFCSAKINWLPKSQNISEILAETNLLPESVLFIDDNPLEIAEVKNVYPSMRTLCVPQENWKHILCYAPETQTRHISIESRQRTELIRSKIERDKVAAIMDRPTFLRSLELVVEHDELTRVDHHNFARALELLNKTNQFNTTGQRWTEAELKAFFSDGGAIFTFTVQDKFANHGLVGLTLVKENELVQMVLSCRVFGLGIETAMLHTVQLHAALPLQAKWIETGRNHTCEGLYPDHGWTALPVGSCCYLAPVIPPAWPDWINSFEER